jgi:hypothetical protein
MLRLARVFALDSPSIDDGYPVPAILYSEDTNAGFPSVDSGFPGTVYVQSTNGGGLTTAQKNYQLLSEFSSTHYPGNVNGSYNNTGVDNWPYKVVPIWIESGGRCVQPRGPDWYRGNRQVHAAVRGVRLARPAPDRAVALRAQSALHPVAMEQEAQRVLVRGGRSHPCLSHRPPATAIPALL